MQRVRSFVVGDWIHGRGYFPVIQALGDCGNNDRSQGTADLASARGRCSRSNVCSPRASTEICRPAADVDWTRLRTFMDYSKADRVLQTLAGKRIPGKILMTAESSSRPCPADEACMNI